MDLDHALRIDPPAALSAESTADQKRAYEQWGSVEEQFKGNSKAHASTLIRKMLTTKYDRVSGVREHIMMMSDMANKLKGMDMKASNNIDLLHESKHFLSRNFDMKDLGEASYVIRIEIHQDRSNGKLGLSQKAYIERVLNRFNMQHCFPTVALVIKGDVFGSHQCPKTEVGYEEMKRILYASVVGSLTCAQVCTRPDIAYICGMLGRFQSNPGLSHWKATKKVLQYLQGTKEYKLTYTRSNNLEVIGYSDSDFAKCKDTSRSTLGYIFMLSGGPISWKNKKQVLTTTSTMMAEYVSVYNATCHAIATVSFSNNSSSTGAGLCLDTKYLFVRERVEEKRICIKHIRTHEMLANPLTKDLPPK
nr:putative zinc finger, CCHC-type [Tanacetum cinerariifolium]